MSESMIVLPINGLACYSISVTYLRRQFVERFGIVTMPNRPIGPRLPNQQFFGNAGRPKKLFLVTAS